MCLRRDLLARGRRMPYTVRPSKGRRGWDIVKTSTGEVVGHSETREKAEASVRARYANEDDGKKRGQR